MKHSRTLAITECQKCKQTIRVLAVDGAEVVFDMKSGDEHVCWDVPEVAELLVLDD